MKAKNPKQNRQAPYSSRHPLYRVIMLLLVAAVAGMLVSCQSLGRADTTRFQEKMELLRQEALADWVRDELISPPAGEIGQVVFVSVSDGTARSDVYLGTGDTLDKAWDNAVNSAKKALAKSGMDPLWVKADLVYVANTVTAEELASFLQSSQPGYFRYGAAMDSNFETAFLEAELNGAKIYDYDEGVVDLNYLNNYLKALEKKPLDSLPQEYILFQTAGWFCGEDSTVCRLSAGSRDFGRRMVETVEEKDARKLVMDASSFLADQVKEDGSFVYEMDSRFGYGIENYSMGGHAGALWALICRYSLEPDEELAEKINQALSYMLSQVVYDQKNQAYLYDENADEIRLGDCGIAVAALTEYMNVFQNKEYKDVCDALGQGILSMLNQDTGEYYHVLNKDFTRKEESRSVSYDGQATFALCRLYGLTKEQKWLDAAQSAVDHFVEADYIEYTDPWVTYSMEEITKYVTDNMQYYIFALVNAQENLEIINSRDAVSPGDLEFLAAAFETYDWILNHNTTVDGFDQELFLETIRQQAVRQLNGYFYPEYAMYMKNPQQVLNTFMVRQENFRVCIDDLYHTIRGYYLYLNNYNKLMSYEMTDGEDAEE